MVYDEFMMKSWWIYVMNIYPYWCWIYDSYDVYRNGYDATIVYPISSHIIIISYPIYWSINRWGFPEIVVPLGLIHLFSDSRGYTIQLLGYPHLWKPHIDSDDSMMYIQYYFIIFISQGIEKTSHHACIHFFSKVSYSFFFKNGIAIPTDTWMCQL